MKMCTHSASVDVCDNSHLEWCQDHGCEEYKKGDSKMNEWKRFEDEWPKAACPVWIGKNGLINTIVPWCDTEETRDDLIWREQKNGSTHWKYAEVPEPPVECCLPYKECKHTGLCINGIKPGGCLNGDGYENVSEKNNNEVCGWCGSMPRKINNESIYQYPYDFFACSNTKCRLHDVLFRKEEWNNRG